MAEPLDTPARPLDLPPPPVKPEPDAAPSRPTTRAGRRALAAQRKAERDARGPTDKTPKAAKPPPRRASLETRLAGSIASIGTGILVAGATTGSEAVQADGLLVVEHSGNVAKALDKLAKDNPAVAAALERMLTAGAWSGVVAATVPIALGVAANHGVLPKALLEQLQAPEADEPPPSGG